MLHPRTRRRAWLAMILTGAGTIIAGILLAGSAQSNLTGLFVTVGALLAIFGAILSAHAFRNAGAEARLRSGEDVVARWHVTASEWDRFAAFDSFRGQKFANEAWLPAVTPAGGVEIVIGSRHVLLGDSLLAFEDPLTRIDLLCLVELPSDPPCLELAILSSGKHQSAYFVRLPVPESARAEVERAIAHLRARALPGGDKIARKQYRYDFGAKLPRGSEQMPTRAPRSGFARRNPQLVRSYGYTAAVATPLLGVHLGSMVGNELGADWGLIVMGAGLALGIAIGFATWFLTRAPSQT